MGQSESDHREDRQSQQCERIGTSGEGSPVEDRLAHLFIIISALATGKPLKSTFSDAVGVWWKIRAGSSEPVRVPPGKPVTRNQSRKALLSADYSSFWGTQSVPSPR